MLKQLIILSTLSAVLGQEYDFTNNLVDFDDSSYQSISLPYPYRDDRDGVINIQSKPIKNAIVMNNGFAEMKRPDDLMESEDVETSLLNIKTSLISTTSTAVTKLFSGVKTAIKHLLKHIPALIFGAILVVAFCKITSICTKISSIQSFSEAQRELTSFITPERLDMASEFVQEAIRRYRAIQAN